MDLTKRITSKPRRGSGSVGDRPGLIRTPEGALKPIIKIISFNVQEVVTSKGEDARTIFEQLDKCQDHTHWIKINGLGDAELIADIGLRLGINDLVLEDIMNIHQRPKFDEYEGYVFATNRTFYLNKDKELVNNQFSALLKDNMIISFEEDHGENFEAVEARIEAGKGQIRTGGPGYICYALMDTIIDRYFVIMDKVGDALDDIEDRLYIDADKSIMFETQQLKRILITLRRASWPERDKINDMIRTDSPLINKETKTYLRDAYDHIIQIMDLIESYKEISANNIDLYLSMVSNRMNEIMKVLTIISVIFIPLTFVAGVYGMNFAATDPDTNKRLPDNMPELYQPHGYIWAMAIMLLIAIIQVLFFWKKGWFRKL
jgi:magnesium transporter